MQIKTHITSKKINGMGVTMQSELSLEKYNKKIIIVNNNMKIGGVQKALLDLLCEISSQYDVTLYLLNRVGEYLDKVPKNVTIIGGDSAYKYFGMSQAESKNSKKDHFFRSILAIIAKVFGRKIASLLINIFSKKIPGEFDCAISYLHDPGTHLLYGGCNDFVISKISAKKKIAFLHCDYENSGSNCKINNKLYSKFNYIAPCSEGCKKSFLRVLPHLESRTKTVINCHNFEEIISLSNENTIIYEKQYVNIIIVARLSPEKGISRALYALYYALERKANVKLHIVGGGGQKEALIKTCAELNLSDNVSFYGEQTNPYRYIKNADFMFIPSFHEAAPLVIDEALCLGVPILSTETTSSDDMILQRNCGWVCKNEQDDINTTLYNIVSNRNEISKVRGMISSRISCNNNTAINMLSQIID